MSFQVATTYGMENSPMYKIVEKTFKPKGLNVLSINGKVWIL
jgi:hypothetical protein